MITLYISKSKYMKWLDEQLQETEIILILTEPIK